MSLFNFFEVKPIEHSLSLLEIIIPNVLLLLVIVLMFFFKKKLKDNANIQRKIEIIFGWSLIILVISYIVWRLITKQFDRNDFPLHLCSLTSIIYALALFKKKYKIIGILFLWGIVGGIGSLVYPALTYPITTFRYWQFYWLHIILVITPIYIYIIKEELPNRQNLFNYIKLSFIITQITLFLELILNITFKTKYTFLHENSPLEIVFGTWPFPFLLIGEVVLVLIHILAYIMWIFIIKRK